MNSAEQFRLGPVRCRIPTATARPDNARAPATPMAACEAQPTRSQLLLSSYLPAPAVARGQRGGFRGGLQDDITPSEAAERYSALLSPELYHLLTVERRWPARQYRHGSPACSTTISSPNPDRSRSTTTPIEPSLLSPSAVQGGEQAHSGPSKRPLGLPPAGNALPDCRPARRLHMAVDARPLGTGPPGLPRPNGIFQVGRSDRGAGSSPIKIGQCLSQPRLTCLGGWRWSPGRAVQTASVLLLPGCWPNSAPP